jgi:hypothetical protein
MPLLHGAQTLDPGKVNAGAGLSGTFANAGIGAAVHEARTATLNTPDGRTAAARGDAVMAAVAPTVAPWVAARVGLASNNEAGLAYTGRAVRLDARHSFEDGSLAYSIGAGISFALAGHEQDGATPNTSFKLGLGSVGADIPLLFGWQSDSGIVTAWIGPRAGFERVTGDAALDAVGTSPSGHLGLNHWYAGGVLGLALGFRHLHGAFELDAYYQNVDGTLAGIDVHVTGLTLAPSAALITTF